MTAPSWITPSGSIGSVTEGQNFSFSLNFTGSPVISVNLIAGSLPPGLSIDPTGVISGTANLEVATTIYQFAIRLTNSDGFADSTFSIEVDNTAPIWSNPSNLGIYPPNSYFQYNFFVSDLGGTAQTFEKITGTLPPGLELNPFGDLYGIVGEVISPTTYTFTIRALFDNGQHLDKVFTITVDPSAQGAPVWLTPPGLLGNAQVSQPVTFQVLAESPNLSAIVYSVIGLPAGLNLNPATGAITGAITSPESITYTFQITATSGAASTSRVFSINANEIVIFSITWITPAGNIGDIKEGDKSLLGVKATSVSPWIRYKITGGSIPLGLTLDINTGQIRGLAEKQLPSNVSQQEFDFVVTAYTETTESVRAFSLILINAYSPGATRVYATLYGNDKLVFIDLFTTQEVMIGSIFRDGDPQFGLINKPRLLIVENLNNPGKDNIVNAMTGVRRTYLNFGKVLVGQAVVNNEVVYEVLYRKIYDDFSGAPVSYEAVAENTAHVEVDIATINPGSMVNIRSRLLALGSSGGHDNLPLWMQSEQTIGDPSTVPGYVPCLEFAYVLPGLGSGIAAKINANDVQLNKLYTNRIRVDRFIMENAADYPGTGWPSQTPPASTWFPSQYILFDNRFYT